MAYARWSNSPWYVFWTSSHVPPEQEGERRHDQRLQVWGGLGADTQHLIGYTELKSDEEAVLVKCVLKDTTPEEREELRGYMRLFIEDVERDDTLLDPLYRDLMDIKKQDERNDAN